MRLQVHSHTQVHSGTKGGFIFGLCFAAFASLFLVIGLIDLSKSLILVTSGEHAVGKVLKVDVSTRTDSKGKRSTTYNSTIEFRSQLDAATTFTASGDYGTGQQVEIIYSTSNPTTARVHSFQSLWGFGAMFSGVGGLFFSVGLYVAWSSWKRLQEIKYLLNHGTRITATVTGVNTHTSRSKRRSRSRSYSIVAQGNDTGGRRRTYTSDSINYDPGDIIGKEIAVYVDPIRSDRYYVEVPQF